jgi:hypothetical protein
LPEIIVGFEVIILLVTFDVDVIVDLLVVETIGLLKKVEVGLIEKVCVLLIKVDELVEEETSLNKLVGIELKVVTKFKEVGTLSVEIEVPFDLTEEETGLNKLVGIELKVVTSFVEVVTLSVEIEVPLDLRILLS